MPRDEQSYSLRSEKVIEHYASGYEAGRLETGKGRIERDRSRELLERFFPPAPATVADIGGGTGPYACWLAQRGYEVHLIDIVPLHVELAGKASAAQPEAQLASARVGDACDLPWDDSSMDAVLLLGPLYHLTDRHDRIRALSEAYRVLRPGGVLLAAGISRFASTMDGLQREFLKDPVFSDIVTRDLEDGQHRNPASHPGYFMDTFFHHPDELRAEVSEAGFAMTGVYGIEGPAWLAANLESGWEDEQHRHELLRIARALESEPTLLGVSAHLMAVGTKV